MMKQWTLFPTVLQRKFLLTLLAGIASAGISVIICVATKDHILLALGIVVLCVCLISCRGIWATGWGVRLRNCFRKAVTVSGSAGAGSGISCTQLLRKANAIFSSVLSSSISPNRNIMTCSYGISTAIQCPAGLVLWE